MKKCQNKKKPNIDVKNYGSFYYNFKKVQVHHSSLNKGSRKGKVIEMNKTMPLWKKKYEKKMKEQLKIQG